MGWRQHELAHLDSHLSWLGETEAANAYAEASRYFSKQGYALAADQFALIETTSAEPYENAKVWLKTRIDAEVLRVIFGRSEVCIVNGTFLMQHWQDMFMPARDDVLVMPPDASWVVYFSHEEEIHFGRR